jgi:hypothetical protein
MIEMTPHAEESPTRSTPYPKEFHNRMLKLYNSGLKFVGWFDELEPCEATIYNCLKRREIEFGRLDDLLTSEQK